MAYDILPEHWLDGKEWREMTGRKAGFGFSWAVEARVEAWSWGLEIPGRRPALMIACLITSLYYR